MRFYIYILSGTLVRGLQVEDGRNTSVTETTPGTGTPLAESPEDTIADLLPFLSKSELEKTDRVLYAEGNYTGAVDDEGRRHGWGEMRWNNGSTYGPDDIFFYSSGDRYVGQWVKNVQEGIYAKRQLTRILIFGCPAAL